MRTIAVANTKGGVGKTTLAVHLAKGLAKDRRVLLADLDPGGHASTWLLGDRPAVGIADAMMAGKLQPAHVVDIDPQLVLAPASPGLDQVEMVLAKSFGRELVLERVIKGVASLFDVVVLDCPPAAGFLTQSAIYAATDVLCPVLASYLGLTGTIDIKRLVREVQQHGRRPTEILGYVLFAADERERVTEDTREALRDGAAGDRELFRSEVRVSTAAKHLPAQRRTAWDPGADDRGLEDYRAILRETKQRLAASERRGERL